MQLVSLAGLLFFYYKIAHPPQFNYWIMPAPAQKVDYQTIFNENGIYIYKPIAGNQCWQQPFPCTPYKIEGLKLRGNDLQSGFKVSN